MSGSVWTSTLQGPTSNQNIDGLLSGSKWSSSDITFRFPILNSEYAGNYQDRIPFTNFKPVTEQMKVAARFALDTSSGLGGASFSVEAFTNLGIAESAGTKAAIRLAQSDRPTLAFAFYPGTGYDEAGDVWFSQNSEYSNPVAGSYAWQTMLHEIGHALGLKHAQEADTFGAVPANRDAMEYTVMTYRSYVGGPLDGYTNEAASYAQTYMMLDIAALQTMYGADYTTNAGNTVYKWDPNSGNTLINGQTAIAAVGNKIFATVWDGGGFDTYDLSSYVAPVQINLRPGEASIFSETQLADLGVGHLARGHIYNALLFNGDERSLIENAIGGGGNDTIYGNQAPNALFGSYGNDALYGFEGSDSLYGQGGADIVVGGAGNDFIFGGEDNDYLEGDGGNDTILGAEGSDTIYGDGQAGGIAGNDWLEGSSGSDTILGQDGNDVVFGQDGNDIIIGGRGSDVLYGGSGFDMFQFLTLDASDYIGDFTRGQDTLLFASTTFGNLSKADITTHFYSGAGFAGFAVSGPYFVYDTNSGNLWYDDAGIAKLVAQMTASSLSSNDFYFV